MNTSEQLEICMMGERPSIVLTLTNKHHALSMKHSGRCRLKSIERHSLGATVWVAWEGSNSRKIAPLLKCTEHIRLPRTRKESFWPIEKWEEPWKNQEYRRLEWTRRSKKEFGKWWSPPSLSRWPSSTWTGTIGTAPTGTLSWPITPRTTLKSPRAICSFRTRPIEKWTWYSHLTRSVWPFDDL